MKKKRKARNLIEATCRIIKVLHLIIAVLMFNVAWIKFYSVNSVIFDHRYSYYLLFGYTLILLFFIRTFNAYAIEYERPGDMLYSQVLGEFLSVAAIYIAVSIAWHHLYNPVPFLVLILIRTVCNAAWCLLGHNMYFYYLPKYKTVVIYRKESDRRRIKEVENYYRRFKIIKKIENPSTIEDVKQFIKGAEAVLVAGVNATLRNGIVKQCLEDDIQCYFAPHIGDIIVSAAQYEKAFSTPILNMRQGNNRIEYLFIKRFFDIVLSLVGLIVLSPLMIIVAILIYSYDKQSPIYKQVRLTKNGKEFVMYKFRSMIIDAEPDGRAMLTAKNDKRLTPVGKIIRRCRIDELPQLWNVIKGDMSLVGPRPERPEIAEKYEEEIPAFKLRLKVKAGLLGYAQVYGKYNTNQYEKLEMDLLYISKMSVITDFILICATIKVLFQKRSTEGF